MLKIDTTELLKEMKDVIEVLIDRKLKLSHNNSTTVLTELEASNYLKISKRTLLNMRKSGGLPKDSYFYIGRSVRYKKEKLISCFSNNTI
tara:strand:- start:39 stop:308 length:270 start_codon:yes stop_codon:yes gene_type:complete